MPHLKSSHPLCQGFSHSLCQSYSNHLSLSRSDPMSKLLQSPTPLLLLHIDSELQQSPVPELQFLIPPAAWHQEEFHPCCWPPTWPPQGFGPHHLLPDCLRLSSTSVLLPGCPLEASGSPTFQPLGIEFGLCYVLCAVCSPMFLPVCCVPACFYCAPCVLFFCGSTAERRWQQLCHSLCQKHEENIGPTCKRHRQYKKHKNVMESSGRQRSKPEYQSLKPGKQMQYWIHWTK